MKKIRLLIAVIFILILVIFIPNIKKRDEVEKENTIDNTHENLNFVDTSAMQNIQESEMVILNENSTKVVQEKNPLENKTIAFIGDSLIQGYGNNERGFEYYLAQSLPSTNFIKNSVSGSTITDNTGTDKIIMINQARTLSGNPDLIVFDGGANDIMGYALGFLNNDLKKNIGTIDMNLVTISPGDSVIVDLEEVVFELKNKFPNAKLCYLQPFLLDDDTINHLTTDINQANEIKLRRDEFYVQVQNLCKKWDIAYIDVAEKFIGTGTTYRQEDWIHIKDEGYSLLTPTILDELKKIFID